jgi:acyl-CoA dehydrogenase
MDMEFFDPEHEAFRSAVRQFVEREVAGRLEDWDERRIIDRATWLAAGKHGLLGFAVPERLGGGGTADYRFRCVLAEELGAVGAASLVGRQRPAGHHDHRPTRRDRLDPDRRQDVHH